MAIKKIPISDATDEQLRDFAEMQQLDVSGAKTRSALMALIGPIWEHDYIPVSVTEATVDEGGEPVELEQTQRVHRPVGSVQGGAGASDPMVRLRIGYTTYPGGRDPVPVGVNGHTVVIQRNIDADVPYRFYHALLNAIRQEVDQTPETGEITVTDVTNYPLTIISMPGTAEIRAWEQETSRELLPA